MANQLFSFDEVAETREPMPRESIRARIIGMRVAPSNRNPENCTCLSTMVPVNPTNPDGNLVDIQFRRVGQDGNPIITNNIMWNRTFPAPAETARKVLDAKIKHWKDQGQDTSDIGLSLQDFDTYCQDDNNVRSTSISLHWYKAMMKAVNYPKNCRGKKVRLLPTSRNQNNNKFCSMPEEYTAPAGAGDIFAELLNGSLQSISMTLNAMIGQEIVLVIDVDDNNYHVVVAAHAPDSKEGALAGLNALPLKDTAQIAREVANDGVTAVLSPKDLLDEVMAEDNGEEL